MKKQVPELSTSGQLTENRNLLASLQQRASALSRLIVAAERKLAASLLDLDYAEGLALVGRVGSEQVNRARQEHQTIEETLEREKGELETVQTQAAQVERVMREIEFEAAMVEAKQFQADFDDAAKATIEAFGVAAREHHRMYLVLQAAEKRFPSSERFGPAVIADTAGLPSGRFLPEWLPVSYPGNKNRLAHLKNLLGRYRPELLPADDPIRIEVERQFKDERHERELIERDLAASQVKETEMIFE